ncbi:hypothetical protein JOB18_012288 [Solea senegalensis]|uniref:Uncharacterized protein n=1 Tax=Solea senegalensis TaxID=28829 RepID=A0AAV6RSE2_SOLSE|nr:hypothetical protein JOB18_012288 [Solea senegalensis]
MELQELADFLRSGEAAMSQIRGLEPSESEKNKVSRNRGPGAKVLATNSERVPEEDINKTPAWYIPHHGVYHPQKPGNIHVVFDCSARGPVAIMCDIKRMFHQFNVKTEDQDYLDYLEIWKINHLPTFTLTMGWQVSHLKGKPSN